MVFIQFITLGFICHDSRSVQEGRLSVGLLHAEASSGSIGVHSSLTWVITFAIPALGFIKKQIKIILFYL